MAKKIVSKKTKTAKVKSASKPKAKKEVAKKVVKKSVADKSVKVKTKNSAKPVKKETKSKPAAKKEVQVTLKKSPAVRDIEVITPIKKPKVMKGYPKKDLEEFKKIILEKRQQIIEQLQALKDQMMDPTTGEYINESSPYSLHMAEQGTDAQEREKLYLWAQRENKFLGYLEEALQRIELGTYGLCLECIDEPKHLCPTCPLIPKERLLAVPHTQWCVQVKMNQKK
jgi:RNA polymerase-binding transcription factor DksA